MVVSSAVVVESVGSALTVSVLDTAASELDVVAVVVASDVESELVDVAVVLTLVSEPDNPHVS